MEWMLRYLLNELVDKRDTDEIENELFPDWVVDINSKMQKRNNQVYCLVFLLKFIFSNLF